MEDGSKLSKIPILNIESSDPKEVSSKAMVETLEC